MTKKNYYDILKRAFRHAERDIGKNSDIDETFLELHVLCVSDRRKINLC